MALDQNAFLKILQAALQHRASDIHLAEGAPPSFRMVGGLVPLQFPPFSATDMESVCRAIMGNRPEAQQISEICDVDGSFELPGAGRFRYNIFRHQKHLGAVLRVIPNKVPTIDELGLPAVLKTIAQNERGLILVTGATGSGKSSTLAAMINEINSTSTGHILTIEDPIEYVHTSQKCRITQREVGSDTESFAKALRSALRQDPDVILVGEMRDIETLDVALKASETGHIVFSTVHTTDAKKTIGRLVAMYPASEQHMVRLRLSENLKSTISQRLIDRADKKGKVVAMEIMISNLAIQECIANAEKTSEMNYFIEVARERLHSQTFDQHLGDLYKSGIVTLETAMEAATNPSDFERNVMLGEGNEKKPGVVDDDALQIEKDIKSTVEEPDPNAIEGLEHPEPAVRSAPPVKPPVPGKDAGNFSVSNLRANQKLPPKRSA